MKNTPSVLTTESVGRGYLCMNGIRFLSMMWILLGHTWQLPTFVLVNARHQQMGEWVGGWVGAWVLLEWMDRYA